MIFFANLESGTVKTKAIIFDENLIRLIGQDDQQAFQELYHTINSPLFAYILSLVQNTQDAEDILQETYLKIRAAAHLYQPQGKPMAWIFTIARNLSMMTLRKQKRNADLDMENLENDRLFATNMDIQDQLVLHTLLCDMEEAERSIILLHAVSGVKHREIAQALSIPLPTVLSKYNRGLKKLRRKLEAQKVSLV